MGSVSSYIAETVQRWYLEEEERRLKADEQLERERQEWGWTNYESQMILHRIGQHETIKAQEEMKSIQLWYIEKGESCSRQKALDIYLENKS